MKTNSDPADKTQLSIMRDVILKLRSAGGHDGPWHFQRSYILIEDLARGRKMQVQIMTLVITSLNNEVIKEVIITSRRNYALEKF